MSSLNFNKVAAAVLATGLAIVGLGQLSSGVFSQEPAMQRFLVAASAPDAGEYIAVYALPINFIWSYSAIMAGQDRPPDRHLTRVQWPGVLGGATVGRVRGRCQGTQGAGWRRGRGGVSGVRECEEIYLEI